MKEAIIKIEKRENNNMEIIQENIRFPQKVLLAKNHSIKSLMKTQTVALEAITNLKEKPQNQQQLSNITYKQQNQQHHQGNHINQQKCQKNLKQQQNSHRQFQNQRQQQQIQREREQQKQDGKKNNINDSRSYNIKLVIVINQKQSL